MDIFERPWGHYEVISLESNYQIKKLVVLPGEELSYQSHKYRAEHWLVVEGVPTVTLDGVKREVSPGESVFVEVGQKHRISNFTTSKISIIEIQFGDYLGEDDIVRYSDNYGR